MSDALREFDAIYEEAFPTVSERGLPFSSAPVQRLYQHYAKVLGSGLEDRFTLPHPDLPDITTEYSDNLWQSGPIDIDPTHEDIELLTKVAFLGRVILEQATVSLEDNPNINHSEQNEDQWLADTYEFFKPRCFYNAHPLVDKDDESGDLDPLSASPVRLKNWPHGEYLNCLGIAIGMAAMAKMRGLRFVFGNELRDGLNYTSQAHQDLMARFDTVAAGGFLANPLAERQYEEMMKALPVEDDFEPEEGLPTYEEILFKDSRVFEVTDVRHDFHHYVVMRRKESWVQVDPYNATLAPLPDHPQEYDELFANAADLYHAPDTVIHDASKTNKWLYEDIGQYLGIVRGINGRYDTLVAALDYKNHKYIYAIEDFYTTELEEIYRLIDEAHPAWRDENSTLNELAGDSVTGLSLSTLACIIKDDLHMDDVYTEWNEIMCDLPQRKNSDISKLFSKMTKIVTKAMQQDTGLRQKVLERYRLLPVTFLAHFYTAQLKEVYFMLEGGISAMASEFGNPEFMIGAMYLNNYANKRKDGKVNIARYLARCSSSQLLWQSAHQEGIVRDPRIMATAKALKQLKPRQLHPLVNIARQLV